MFLKKKKGIAALLAALLFTGCGKEPAVLTEASAAGTAKGTELVYEMALCAAPAADRQVSSLQTCANSIREEMKELATPEVTLVMVGDILMHMPVNNSGRLSDGSRNFDHLFTYTKDMIEAADIAIVNQEVILGGPELGISGYPRFNTYYEVGDALVNAGFDVILHATNHSLDRGREGIENCLSFWEENYPDIAVVGIYESAKAQEEIYVCEQQGIKIAILNYTYGTNGLPFPAGMPYAVNLLDREKIEADVARAKEMADFVVLCPHWGTEYVLKESQNQRDWAAFFLECGVDLVIGTHPHVIEPVEMLYDEDGNGMLVYYSLGNYVNATAGEDSDIGTRMLGAMATVTISRNEEGEVYIKEYGAEPLVTYFSADRKTVLVYPMEEFTDEMAADSFTIKRDKDFSPAYCQEIWEQVFGNLQIG